ncbi:hypothetical protein MMC17_007077 [Xylographa soralifera]|nr:hypothetical protein [Xylographa soralifera]
MECRGGLFEGQDWETDASEGRGRKGRGRKAACSAKKRTAAQRSGLAIEEGRRASLRPATRNLTAIVAPFDLLEVKITHSTSVGSPISTAVTATGQHPLPGVGVVANGGCRAPDCPFHTRCICVYIGCCNAYAVEYAASSRRLSSYDDSGLREHFLGRDYCYGRPIKGHDPTLSNGHQATLRQRCKIRMSLQRQCLRLGGCDERCQQHDFSKSSDVAPRLSSTKRFNNKNGLFAVPPIKLEAPNA